VSVLEFAAFGFAIGTLTCMPIRAYFDWQNAKRARETRLAIAQDGEEVE
jgi:hypothetical protein